MNYRTKLAAIAASDAFNKIASRFRDEARAANEAVTKAILEGKEPSYHRGLSAAGHHLELAGRAAAKSPFMRQLKLPEPPAFTAPHHEWTGARNPEVKRRQMQEHGAPSFSGPLSDYFYGLSSSGEIPGPRPGEGMNIRKRNPGELYFSPAEEMELRNQRALGTPIVGVRRERPVAPSAPQPGLIGAALRRLGLR